jgi:hypothetical protein
LDNIPSSFTNQQKRQTRHTLREKLKEHHYAWNNPPFQPSQYELIFINRTTSTETLIKLDDAINQSNIFTLDTESINIPYQPNQPALIQLQIVCSENSSSPSTRIHANSKIYLNNYLTKKKIFIWGEIDQFIQPESNSLIN